MVCSNKTTSNLDSESCLFNYHELDNPNLDSQSNQSSLNPGLFGLLYGLIIIYFWIVNLITPNTDLD